MKSLFAIALTCLGCIAYGMQSAGGVSGRLVGEAEAAGVVGGNCHTRSSAFCAGSHELCVLTGCYSLDDAPGLWKASNIKVHCDSAQSGVCLTLITPIDCSGG
jgi:hypothetical protein